MGLISSIKSWLHDYKVKNLKKNIAIRKYTRYKIDTITTEDKAYSFEYDKFSIWDSNEILELEVLYNKNILHISEGKAIPIVNLVEIKATPIEEELVYYFDTISGLPSKWLTKEEIDENHRAFRNEIELLEEGCVHE